MSTEKDNELENEDFEDAFGISDDFDEDEFDIDEADLEDDDILAGFPEPESNTNAAFGGSDDFSDMDEFGEDDFSEDVEEDDFSEDDFSETLEEDVEEDDFSEETEEFEEESSEEDEYQDAVSETKSKSNKIAKMAFYLGTVAILGGIGFVGVQTFMPNIFGGSPQYVASDPVKTQVNSPVNVPSPNNSNIVVGNTPPTPAPINQTFDIQKPNQGNAPELTNNRPNLAGMGNDVVAPNENTITQVNNDQFTKPIGVLPGNPLVNPGDQGEEPGDRLIDLSIKFDNEITDISSSISEMKEAFLATMSRIDSMENKFVSKQDLDGSVRTIVSSLLPKMESNSNNGSQFEKIISELRNEIQILSSKIDDKNSPVITEINNTEELDKLSNQISMMRDEISSLNNQLLSSNNTIKDLEAVIEKQDKELTDAKKSVARVRSEAKKRQDAANAVGSGIVPPSKPSVISNYRLAGVSRNTAWIESSSGTMRVNVGQTIPGIGLIEAIVPADGNWSLVTENGIIIP